MGLEVVALCINFSRLISVMHCICEDSKMVITVCINILYTYRQLWYIYSTAYMYNPATTRYDYKKYNFKRIC